MPIVVYYHADGVVSVDYRLAPEHPFPAGVDDSWAVLRRVGEHAFVSYALVVPAAAEATNRGLAALKAALRKETAE